ncbi:MAG: 16S rRNA (guanine(966)-N(2))-methyltransferase RsmD [Verrucomicrobiae bacterium]|nr:16S rRNA (guanine(966)-N(2))-methyltransferase RsmD [Verrucomicrobiae bacterium]
MRITGGQAGGRILKVPKGLAVRPTIDRLKQALFNSLGERIVSARVLELFAGSGALSLESLSRGAQSVVCVELSPRHAAFIRSNVEAAGLPVAHLTVRTQDVFAALPQLVAAQQTFDLILADPPYGEKNREQRSTSFAQRLLDDPHLPQVLAPDGRFALGHAKRDRLEVPAPWRELKQLNHGDSVIRFFETTPVKP